MVAKSFRVEIGGLVIMPFGVTIRIKNNFIRIPSHEILICAAGPIMSGILAFLGLLITSILQLQNELLHYFIYANLAICLINLLPVLPLDGGRMLRAALTHNIGFTKACSITIKITKLMIVILAAAGCIVLWLTKFNMSVVLIASFLTFNLSAESQQSTMMIMRQLANSPQKLKREGFMPLRHLIAMDTVKAKELTGNLSYNHFYVIEVVDDSIGNVGSITESQLVDGMVILGSNADLSQILKLNY